MWLSSKLTTVILGQRDIRLLAADRKGIRFWKSQDIPVGWIQAGRIVEKQNVAAVIASLRDSFRASGGETIVSVSGLAFIRRTVTLPRMKTAMVDDAVRYQLKDDSSVPLQQMSISWRVIDEHDDEVTYSVTGVDAAVLAEIAETMRMAGIQYWSLELQSLALGRLLPLPNALLLNLEQDSFEVCRFIDGKPATVYTVHLDESVPDSRGYEEQVLSVTSNALRQRPDKHWGQDTEVVLPVFLTGALADDLRLVGAINDGLGYASEFLELPGALPPGFRFHRYSTNVGLLACSKAHSHFRRLSSPSNCERADLLAGRYQRQSVSLSVIPWTIILVLVVVVGHLLPIYAGKNANADTVQYLQNENRLVSLQLVHARQAATEQTDLQSQVNAILQQADTLRNEIVGVTGNPGELTRHLLAIVQALPANCSFESLQVSDDGITMGVRSESLNDLFGYTDALTALDPSYQVRISLVQETPGKSTEPTEFAFKVVIKK